MQGVELVPMVLRSWRTFLQVEGNLIREICKSGDGSRDVNDGLHTDPPVVSPRQKCRVRIIFRRPGLGPEEGRPSVVRRVQINVLSTAATVRTASRSVV